VHTFCHWSRETPSHSAFKAHCFNYSIRHISVSLHKKPLLLCSHVTWDTSHCIQRVTLQSLFIHSTNDAVLFLLQQPSSSSKDYLIGAGVGVGLVICVFFVVVVCVRRKCLPGIPNVKLIASVNPEYVNTGKCQPSLLIHSILWYYNRMATVFIDTTSKTIETVINTKHFTRITRQFQNQPPIGW
jgi:hypothetical protein